MMKQYPIHVPRKQYRGSKTNLRIKNQEYNRIASELENVVNRIIEESDENLVHIGYHEVAHKTGYSVDVVREILFGVDCGHNRLTAFKRHETEL
jgi:hypothetical protein